MYKIILGFFISFFLFYSNAFSSGNGISFDGDLDNVNNSAINILPLVGTGNNIFYTNNYNPNNGWSIAPSYIPVNLLGFPLKGFDSPVYFTPYWGEESTWFPRTFSFWLKNVSSSKMGVFYNYGQSRYYNSGYCGGNYCYYSLHSSIYVEDSVLKSSFSRTGPYNYYGTPIDEQVDETTTTVLGSIVFGSYTNISFINNISDTGSSIYINGIFIADNLPLLSSTLSYSIFGSRYNPTTKTVLKNINSEDSRISCIRMYYDRKDFPFILQKIIPETFDCHMITDEKRYDIQQLGKNSFCTGSVFAPSFSGATYTGILLSGSLDTSELTQVSWGRQGPLVSNFEAVLGNSDNIIISGGSGVLLDSFLDENTKVSGHAYSEDAPLSSLGLSNTIGSTLEVGFLIPELNRLSFTFSGSKAPELFIQYANSGSEGDWKVLLTDLPSNKGTWFEKFVKVDFNGKYKTGFQTYSFDSFTPIARFIILIPSGNFEYYIELEKATYPLIEQSCSEFWGPTDQSIKDWQKISNTELNPTTKTLFEYFQKIGWNVDFAKNLIFSVPSSPTDVSFVIPIPTLSNSGGGSVFIKEYTLVDKDIGEHSPLFEIKRQAIDGTITNESFGFKGMFSLFSVLIYISLRLIFVLFFFSLTGLLVYFIVRFTDTFFPILSSSTFNLSEGAAFAPISAGLRLMVLTYWVGIVGTMFITCLNLSMTVYSDVLQPVVHWFEFFVFFFVRNFGSWSIFANTTNIIGNTLLVSVATYAAYRLIAIVVKA